LGREAPNTPQSISTAAPVSPHSHFYSPSSPVSPSSIRYVRVLSSPATASSVKVKVAGSPKAQAVPAISPQALSYPAGLGFTPLHATTGLPTFRRTVSVHISTPMASPGPTTPGSILQKYGFSQGIAYPPGLGFTPCAQTLKRTVSFGLAGPSPKGATSVSMTAVPESPQKAQEECPPCDVFPRELLLLFKDNVGSEHANAEEAGFALPQPGWLKTEKHEAPAPAPQSQVKVRQGRSPPRPAEAGAAAAPQGATVQVQQPSQPPSQQQHHHQQQQYQNQWWQNQQYNQQGWNGQNAGWWIQTPAGEWKWQTGAATVQKQQPQMQQSVKVATAPQGATMPRAPPGVHHVLPQQSAQAVVGGKAAFAKGQGKGKAVAATVGGKGKGK